MAKWIAHVDNDLNHGFYEVVFMVERFEKRAFKEAQKEAIELWLKKHETSSG